MTALGTLRDRRLTTWNEASALVAAVTGQDRGFTAAEQASWDALNAELVTRVRLDGWYYHQVGW